MYTLLNHILTIDDFICILFIIGLIIPLCIILYIIVSFIIDNDELYSDLHIISYPIYVLCILMLIYIFCFKNDIFFIFVARTIGIQFLCFFNFVPDMFEYCCIQINIILRIFSICIILLFSVYYFILHLRCCNGNLTSMFEKHNKTVLNCGNYFMYIFYLLIAVYFNDLILIHFFGGFIYMNVSICKLLFFIFIYFICLYLWIILFEYLVFYIIGYKNCIIFICKLCFFILLLCGLCFLFYQNSYILFYVFWSQTSAFLCGGLWEYVQFTSYSAYILNYFFISPKCIFFICISIIWPCVQIYLIFFSILLIQLIKPIKNLKVKFLQNIFIIICLILALLFTYFFNLWLYNYMLLHFFTVSFCGSLSIKFICFRFFVMVWFFSFICLYFLFCIFFDNFRSCILKLCSFLIIWAYKKECVFSPIIIKICLKIWNFLFLLK
jgi:hypothetical protein